MLGTAGNLSQRSGELVAITPTGAVLAELAAEDVCVVDLDGSLIDGSLAPTSELELHLGAIRAHGAGAVVHTHAPMSTAAACVLDELPCVHYGMLALGGTVRVAPYSTSGTPELAGAVLDALEDRVAALMANHGAITLAADVPAAAELTLLLEWACTVYWRASMLGEPRSLDQDQREAVIAAVVDRGYGDTRPASQDEDA